MDDRYRVKAIDRALNVLECLAANGQGLTLVELARKTDIPKSTLYRIMSTLEARQCVTQDEERNTYQLGLHLMELGHAFLDQSSLFDAAEKHLERLAERLGESVYLGLLDEEEVLFVRKKESPKSAVLVRKIGQRAPVYCTATGLAIMAFRPDAETERILDKAHLKAHSPKTTTDRAVLAQKLRKVRNTGVAVVDGEYNPALLCVSSPVFDKEGTAVASLTAAILSSHAQEAQIEDMKTQIREAARDLSEERGHVEARLPTDTPVGEQ